MFACCAQAPAAEAELEIPDAAPEPGLPAPLQEDGGAEPGGPPPSAAAAACPLCGKQFRPRGGNAFESILKHLRTVDDAAHRGMAASLAGSAPKCLVCGEQFGSPAEAVEHIVCSECSKGCLAAATKASCEGKGRKRQSGDGAERKRARQQQLAEWRQALYAAAKGGDAEAVRGALQAAAARTSEDSKADEEASRRLKADVLNFRFDDRYTALMTAAEAGHSATVRLLLSEGADAAAKNAYGQSAVHLATLQGQSGAVAALLEPPDARQAAVSSEHQGATTLEWAAKLGHADIVGALLEAGSDVGHLDANGRSALCLAVMADDPSVAIVQKLAEWPGCDLRRAFPVSSGLHTLAEFARHQGHEHLVPVLTPRPDPAAEPGPVEPAGGRGGGEGVRPEDAVAGSCSESSLKDGYLVMSRYRIQGEPLGEGGWCVVYAALDTRSGARVAVKTYRGQSLREAGEDAIFSRFEREVRTFEDLGLAAGPPRREASAKAWHQDPRRLFVNLLDYSRGPSEDHSGTPKPGQKPGRAADGRFYTVLELADGGSLEAWLPSRSANAEEALVQLRDVGQALAAALAWLARRGLCHCDLKPANVMRFSGRWKIIDIEGAASLASPSAAVKPDDFTPLYACPELGRAWLDALPASGGSGRAASCTPSSKMDVWSAGVVLLDVLARQCAFEDEFTGFQSAAFMELDGTEGDDAMGLREWYEWLVDSTPILPKDYASPPSLPVAREGTEMHALLTGLLAKDPSQRLSIEQFRAHPALGLPTEADGGEPEDADARPAKCRCLAFRRSPAKRASS